MNFIGFARLTRGINFCWQRMIRNRHSFPMRLSGIRKPSSDRPSNSRYWKRRRNDGSRRKRELSKQRKRRTRTDEERVGGGGTKT